MRIPPRISILSRMKPVLLTCLLPVLLASPQFAFGQSQTQGTQETQSGDREYDYEYQYSDGNYSTYTGYPFSNDSTLGADDYTYQATFPKVEEAEIFQAEYSPDGEYRQPTSICFTDSNTALIATKLGGGVYEFSWPVQKVQIAWEDANASWGDIAKISSDLIAILEKNSNQVQLFSKQGQTWKCIDTLDAPGHPHTVRFDSQTKSLLVTGQWSQRMYRWQMAGGLPTPEWKDRETLDLPMCAGQFLVLPEHQKILVMDAFGRHYAVIDQDSFEVEHHAEVYGHNIAGLAATTNEEMVFFPHQLLNEIARSERTDITWGGLMSNNIRWLMTDRLLTMSGEDIFRKGKFYPLGTPGNGAGDPSSMAVSSDGQIAITLAGTNRVTIGRKDDYYFKQVDVGYRPIDCVYTPDETHLIVVNQFSDSLTVVDLEDLSPKHISLGKLRAPTNQERGEQLFFSAALAHDRWMSCHSCHSNGHSNGQLNDNKSDLTFGTPKRVLSLLGQAETAPYAWGGNIKTIAEQVKHSVTSTMAGPGIPPDAVTDLATYVESLPSPPSLLQARSEDTSETSSRQSLVSFGREVFTQQGCAQCHSGKLFTSSDTYDVGIHDEEKMTHFNPPSLSGVSQRGNLLFHDGRVASLREVFTKERHQLQRELSDGETQALIHFLQSL